MIRNGH